MPRPDIVTAFERAELDTAFINCDRAGYTTRQLAERFNITERSVTRWRNRLGIRHGPPPFTYPVTVHEHAERLLDDGCSFHEAARTLGVCPTTLYRWFPDRPRWSKQEVAEFAVLVRTLGRAA